MRFLIVGAGAIGTYIGGSLAQAEYPVTFLVRPETKVKISRLTLKLDGRTVTIEIPSLATSMEEALKIRPYDVILLATKSFDTQSIIDSWLPFTEQIPPILCLQNGIGNEANLMKAFGKDKVIPGTVTTAVGRQAAGEITLERLRGIGIGSRHPLSNKLYHAFQGAHLNPNLFENTDSMKWSKLLTNLIANASSAILRMTPDAIYSSPALFRVEAEMLKEALAVMDAQGIPVTDLPSTPVRLLATAIRSIPLPLLRPLLKNAVVGGRGEKMPSFYIDMQAGRKKSEVDFLNGAVFRFGEKAGVPTPINRFLTETLGGMVSGVIPKEQYQDNPERFLQNQKR